MIMRSFEVVIIGINPVDTWNHLPPINPSLDAPRQFQLQFASVPTGKLHSDQHNSWVVGAIGHSSMPETEVADDERSFGQARLDRWSYFPPLSLKSRFDLVGLWIEDADIGVGVSAQPDFSGAILRGHVDQVDVDAVSKGYLGKIKVDINMWWLTASGFEGGIGAVEAQSGIWAQHALNDLGRPGVGNDVLENVAVLEHRFLLDVACVGPKVAMRIGSGIEIFGFGYHSLVEFVEMFRVHGVVEHHETIPMECLNSRLEVVRIQTSVLELLQA